MTTPIDDTADTALANAAYTNAMEIARAEIDALLPAHTKITERVTQLRSTVWALQQLLGDSSYSEGDPHLPTWLVRPHRQQRTRLPHGWTQGPGPRK